MRYNRETLWKRVGWIKSFGGGVRFHADVYKEVISFENLIAAWREFKKGKLQKPDVLDFSEKAEEQLLALRDELVSGSYRHGQYTRFFVHDPKQRHIAKAYVRDRVLHHAVVRVIGPLFERRFIFDSFASRKGKGLHMGIERVRTRAVMLSRNNTKTLWFLKCDVRKFFDSVDHALLLALLRKRIADVQLLELLTAIIASYSKQEGKGIPLGNITSQLFANMYLDPLDQFITRRLGHGAYFRYMDDLLFLGIERTELEHLLPKIETFLRKQLLLELHPTKTIFRKWHQGIDFLGYVHFPHFRTVRTKTKQRMFRKMRPESKQSYLGVLSHANARGLARRVRRK